MLGNAAGLQSTHYSDLLLKARLWCNSLRDMFLFVPRPAYPCAEFNPFL